MNGVTGIGSHTTNGTKILRKLRKDWNRLQDMHVAPNIARGNVHRSYDLTLAPVILADSQRGTFPRRGPGRNPGGKLRETAGNPNAVRSGGGLLRRVKCQLLNESFRRPHAISRVDRTR
jgi:hypothetical protein